MEKLFELTFQDQTLNPQVGTFTDASQTTGTFTLEDGEYYLTNADTKGFYAYAPIAIQPDSGTDNKITVEFDLKVVTASVNTHTIIGTYAGVDGSGIPTGAKITLQYNAGDIELVLGSGTTETLIAAADVVVDQWYHFRIDCALDAPTESTYEVKIDGTAVTTVTGATTDYELGIIGVLGTNLHACDECGIKNIHLITDDDYFVGRTALNQAFRDTKGYVDTHCMDLTSAQTAAGDKTFAGTTTTHDVIPATTDTYDLGSSAKEYNNAYIKALTINGTAAGDILTHNASEFVPVAGGSVITGGHLGKATNNSSLLFSGGSGWDYGAGVSLYGKDSATNPGFCLIRTYDGINSTTLSIQPNGYVAIGDNFAFNPDVSFRIGNNNVGDFILLRDDGVYWNNLDRFIPLTNASVDLGSGGNVWKSCYLANAPVIVSDARAKTQTQVVDDRLLDAWGNVEIKTYKMISAVEKKGEKARYHTGYLAQDIQAECEKQGVNASDYGLFCYDEWEEQEEVSEEIETKKDGKKVKEKRVIQPKREKGNSYALRYEEALVVECKYLRRCIARLTARIEQLEKGKEREASK